MLGPKRGLIKTVKLGSCRLVPVSEIERIAEQGLDTSHAEESDSLSNRMTTKPHLVAVGQNDELLFSDSRVASPATRACHSADSMYCRQ